MTIECVVSADLFARAAKAAGNDDGRWYLHGVHLEPAPNGGVLLVATDGRALIALRDAGGYASERVIIRLNPSMLKACTIKSDPVVLGKGIAMRRIVAVRDQKAAVGWSAVECEPAESLSHIDEPRETTLALQWCHTIIDGTFPDWRRIIGKPNPDSGVADIGFPVIQPVLKALTDKSFTAFRLVRGAEGQHGAHFIFVENVDGFGVVMPMRSGIKVSVPEWFSAGPEAIKAAAE